MLGKLNSAILFFAVAFDSFYCNNVAAKNETALGELGDSKAMSQEKLATVLKKTEKL